MLCDLCSVRNAIIHIHQVIGNKKRELHLCEKCAEENGVSNIQEKMDADVAHIFSGLFNAKPRPEKPVCPECGTTFDEVNKRNRLGCNYCYFTFSKLIRLKMKKLVKKRQYTGKVPKKLHSYKILFIDVEELKSKLQEAVENENYEMAAAIRDEINKLKHAERLSDLSRDKGNE